MSYCRWSSDNWRCDVYVYDGGCFVTHVARWRRPFGPIPELPTMYFGQKFDIEARSFVYPTKLLWLIGSVYYWLWGVWHRMVHMASLRLIPLLPIKLPHAGEVFEDSSPGLCADRLEWLRSLGYRVPQHAIDELRDEERYTGSPD